MATLRRTWSNRVPLVAFTTGVTHLAFAGLLSKQVTLEFELYKELYLLQQLRSAVSIVHYITEILICQVKMKFSYKEANLNKQNPVKTFCDIRRALYLIFLPPKQDFSRTSLVITL